MPNWEEVEMTKTPGRDDRSAEELENPKYWRSQVVKPTTISTIRTLEVHRYEIYPHPGLSAESHCDEEDVFSQAKEIGAKYCSGP